SSPFPCTTLFRSDLYPARVACRGISAGALAAIPSGGSGAAAIGGYFSIVALTVHFLRAGQQFTQPASIISNELRAVHLFPSCPGKGGMCRRPSETRVRREDLGCDSVSLQ